MPEAAARRPAAHPGLRHSGEGGGARAAEPDDDLAGWGPETRHLLELRAAEGQTTGAATRAKAEPATPARFLSWAQLSPEQRRAARVLQYGEYMWDHGLIPMETTACAFGKSWHALIAQQRNAARVLGWTAEAWDAEYHNIAHAQNPGSARDARYAGRQ